MKLSKSFISSLAAVAVAGTIGVAFAQSNTQAPAGSAQRSGDYNTTRDSTGAMNPENRTGMSNDSNTNMRNNANNTTTRDSTGAMNTDNRTGASSDTSMRSERVAKGDRN